VAIELLAIFQGTSNHINPPIPTQPTHPRMSDRHRPGYFQAYIRKSDKNAARKRRCRQAQEKACELSQPIFELIDERARKRLKEHTDKLAAPLARAFG